MMNKLLADVLDRVIVVDVEATGVDVKVDEILQLARGIYINGELDIVDHMYDCDCEITPMVSSINNIVKHMVAGKPKFKDAIEADLVAEIKSTGKRFMVAHNSTYDSNILATNGFDADVQWLCTRRISQKLFAADTSFENFKLNYLRYRMGLDIPNGPNHDARFDVLITAKLFERLAEILIELGVVTDATQCAQQIYDWMEAPVILDHMTFGKYKGQKFSEIPLSYWTWAFDNLEILDDTSDKYDPDFAASVAKALDILL